MPPDEIRALYIETLARIVYERTQRAMNYPMNMPPWEVPPGESYVRDGITVLQVGKFDPRRRYRAQAALDVEALAEAGLLPIAAEWRLHCDGDVYVPAVSEEFGRQLTAASRGVLECRHVGAWMEVAE